MNGMFQGVELQQRSRRDRTVGFSFAKLAGVVLSLFAFLILPGGCGV
jgi:hypothetical protein